MFANSIGEVRGLEFARIDFEVADDLASWQAEIPGRLVSGAVALGGPTTLPGQRVQVHNPGGSEVGPNAIATYGTSTADKAQASGFKWDRVGRSSKHIRFDWSGPEQCNPGRRLTWRSYQLSAFSQCVLLRAEGYAHSPGYNGNGFTSRACIARMARTCRCLRASPA